MTHMPNLRAAGACQWHYPSATGRIDAVIVDYGTPELAAACLESARHCDLFASVCTMDAKALGWSYSRCVNTALRAATVDGEFVLALNADTRMLERPTAVLDLFDADEKIAVVGPRQVNAEGRITHAGIVGTNEHPQHRFWQRPLADVESQCREWLLDCVTVSGSVYFARRSVWEDLGGFLETDHFYEETWLSYLARHRGYRVIYTGAATWIHDFNQSPVDGAWRTQVARESREIFRTACAVEGIPCD